MLKLIQIFTSIALANSEAHQTAHGPGGIPWSDLGPQFFNFTLFLGLLIYILRKPIADTFSQRSKSYKELLGKADQALKEAQSKKNEIQKNLDTLKRTRDNSLNKARQEAEELKRNLVNEAQAQSKKMFDEVERTIRVETEKAKTELRNFLLQQAILQADKGLKDQLDETEQKRLQKEFAGKIQVI